MTCFVLNTKADRLLHIINFFILRQGLQNNWLLPLCCFSTEQFAYMCYKALLNNKIVQPRRKTIWLNLPRQNVGTQFPAIAGLHIEVFFIKLLAASTVVSHCKDIEVCSRRAVADLFFEMECDLGRIAIRP